MVSRSIMLHEVLGHHDRGAQHGEAAGQRQHLVRQAVRLEQHVPLAELQREPVAVPVALARDEGALVAGDRAEVAVGHEEGQHPLERARLQPGVAVHEDGDAVRLVVVAARHRPQRVAHGDALALALALEHQLDAAARR
jgi:hypothetical protein